MTCSQRIRLSGPAVELDEGVLDFSSLERVSNSFVSADLRERHSDLIWRLQLRGDEEG
jgi:hypothetical protein